MKYYDQIFYATIISYFLVLFAGSKPALSQQPVARWDFRTEEELPLRVVKGVRQDVPGPRPPEFPDFPTNNNAIYFEGDGARLVFADPGGNSPFDFDNGDEITLEAWVSVKELNEGSNVYLLGKGRTGREGYPLNNQNWALRLQCRGGQACVGFLFAAADARSEKESWHRYTTHVGFPPQSGWHHIAITYRFGDPHSISAWIDGVKTTGFWDMGGATKKAPIVDDDEIWIGSSMNGNSFVSFQGGLDSIAIHREILDDKILKNRFRRVEQSELERLAPEVMPQVGPLAADKVHVTFHEGFPEHTRWLLQDEEWPQVAATWKGESFLLDQLPLRYDDWGIRSSWKAPVVVRMSGDVKLPPGSHTILLRSQGLARVWIDGQLVARTEPLTGSEHGEERMTPVAPPPAPGHRPKWHTCQEAIGKVSIEQGGKVRVVLEAIAGGKRFRADPGELTLAISTDQGKSFSVLRPAGLTSDLLPLTDQAVDAELDRIGDSMNRLNDNRRRAAAASQKAYWQKRHAAGMEWLKKHPQPKIPKTKRRTKNPIDAFILARIEEVETIETEVPTKEASLFHSQVLPILKSECFRCHGEKNKGGLSLNSRELAIDGGYSGEPAIQPGDPHASEMMARIRSADAETRMPPGGKPLAKETIEILDKWIADGAKWPKAASSHALTKRA
ncbi:MAG: c-type cytochrome domain-containing protein, partial [Blastopirellula sp. JB062]